MSTTTTELLEHGFVPNVNKRVRRPPLDALTGLRFFAAFYVMLFHFGAGFTDRAHMPRAVTVFLEHGNLGVSLFFLLSGFILFYTYAGNLQTGRDLYRFFVARFCRIYPVYLLAAVLEAIALQRLPRGHDLAYFTLLQSWTPAASPGGYAWIMQSWSLSVEIFFYCCFPLLLPFVVRLKSPKVIWPVIIVIALIAGYFQLPVQHSGMTVPNNPVDPIFLPLLRLPEFILGMLVCSLFLSRTKEKETSFLDSDWITIACMIPPMALIASGTKSWLLSLGAIFWFLWTIYRLANGKGWLTRLLSTKFFILLGGASYSIYLLQGPVREILRRHVHHGLDAVLSPIVLVLVSILIFLYYEEPLRERLRAVLTGPSKR